MIPIPIFAYKWLAIGGVILLLGAAVWGQSSRLENCKKEYAEFVAKVKESAGVAFGPSFNTQESGLGKSGSDGLVIRLVSCSEAKMVNSVCHGDDYKVIV